MFLSAAVLGLTAFMLSFFVRDHYRRPESRGEERKPEREKTGSGLKGSLLVLILLPSAVNLFALTSKSAIDSFLTPCGLSRGLEQISLYFLVNNLTVICARLLMGRVISRFSKRACVFTGLLLAAGIRGTAAEEGGRVVITPIEYLAPKAQAERALGQLMPLHVAWSIAGAQ